MKIKKGNRHGFPFLYVFLLNPFELHTFYEIGSEERDE